MTREREASRQGSTAGHLAGKNQLLGLVFCHHPAASCVTLQLVRPVGKSGACCLQTGVSLRVEEGVFLGIHSCLEGPRAAAFSSFFGGLKGKKQQALGLPAHSPNPACGTQMSLSLTQEDVVKLNENHNFLSVRKVETK